MTIPPKVGAIELCGATLVPLSWESIVKIWPRVVEILGILAIVVPILGLVGTRLGWTGFQFGFLCLGLGVVSGALAFFAGLVGHVVVFAKGLGPMSDRPAKIHIRLVVGELMGFAVSALVLVLFLQALQYPLLYDISTDVEDPPVFKNAVEIRGPTSNPLAYNEGIAAAQQAAYPDIKPYINEEITVNSAFTLALDVALEMKWEIVFQDKEDSVFEAVATTFWYGFTDDIVVRVRPSTKNRGSIVDIRSASRVGVADMGTNARRIGMFLQNFAEKVKDEAGDIDS